MARKRMKRCDLASKSCANPAASEGAGNSVSPSAVTAPVAPTTSMARSRTPSTTVTAGGAPPLAPEAYGAAPRRPPGGRGSRGQEQERVDQVKADAERALHRRVVRDQFE